MDIFRNDLKAADVPFIDKIEKMEAGGFEPPSE